jgi:hypothetical protein
MKYLKSLIFSLYLNFTILWFIIKNKYTFTIIIIIYTFFHFPLLIRLFISQPKWIYILFKIFINKLLTICISI